VRIAGFNTGYVSLHHPLNAANLALVTGWRAVAKHVFIWDGGVDNTKWTLVPQGNYLAEAQHIRELAQLGATGYFAEGSGIPGADMCDLKTYLAGRMAFDPTLDENALLSNFTEAYYEAASVHMGKYVELMADAFAHHNRSNDCFGAPLSALERKSIGPTNAIFANETVLQAAALLSVALQAASEPRVRDRVAFDRMHLQYVLLKRWESLRDFAARTQAAWPAAASKQEEFEAFAAAYNGSGIRSFAEMKKDPARCGGALPCWTATQMTLGQFRQELFGGAHGAVKSDDAEASVTFESVGLVNSAIRWPNGQEAFRSDPSALSFIHPSGDPDRAVVLVFSSDGAASTNTGGRSWETVGKFGHLTPSKTVGQDLALDGWLTIPGKDARGVYRRSIAADIREAATWGQTKVVPLAPGPWKSAGEFVTRPNWAATRANESTTTTVDGGATHIDTYQPATGGPEPGSPLVFLSFASGGVAGPLPDGTFVATPSIRYSRKSDYAQQINDCNPLSTPPHNASDSYCESVVAFVSDTTGRNWTMRSTIASPRDMIKGNPRLPRCPAGGCEEGPSENDITVLRDGRTLLNVMRIDGGDGQPHNYHVPFLLARSTDLAHTWTVSQAPPTMLSARPELLTLANGVVLLSGGRPGLGLWVSSDGDARSWKGYDIPSEHNKLVSTREQGCGGPQGCRFCRGFCNVVSAAKSYHCTLCVYACAPILFHPVVRQTCKPPCGAGQGIYAGGWFQSSGELKAIQAFWSPCPFGLRLNCWWCICSIHVYRGP